MLVDKICKHQMDPASIVEIQNGHDSVVHRPDEWTDRGTK